MRIDAPNPFVTGASAGDTPKTPSRGGKAALPAMTTEGSKSESSLKTPNSKLKTDND